ncbi:Addiction module toxin, RelE/StbE family [Crenothrix polyspora]|uniref:Addiction module toxin, RelE/StbE family n=1 Tax=Crenothrix polyspora TaxID=360316 RepID=A0A1R4H288_9GAMM|nr:type II toxin-antitoxin system RelE/ParE family toxin [Crenothrix polyspora]SJM90362.1 Addiction module toxin, RelE/StbE family [Crenothrix polyspora]
MMWTIKLNSLSAKELNKLDKPIKQRIEAFIDDLSTLDNPRQTGKALQGDLKGLWRYRVGDYRLIAQIKDGELIILVVELGHRKDIYK